MHTHPSWHWFSLVTLSPILAVQPLQKSCRLFWLYKNSLTDCFALPRAFTAHSILVWEETIWGRWRSVSKWILYPSENTVAPSYQRMLYPIQYLLVNTVSHTSEYCIPYKIHYSEDCIPQYCISNIYTRLNSQWMYKFISRCTQICKMYTTRRMLHHPGASLSE